MCIRDRVCRYVNADHFINKLDHGLDEEVRERGNNFSAGQRQLLSFCLLYTSCLSSAQKPFSKSSGQFVGCSSSLGGYFLRKAARVTAVNRDVYKRQAGAHDW